MPFCVPIILVLVDEQLTRAFVPVLHDLGTAGIVVPQLKEAEWKGLTDPEWFFVSLITPSGGDKTVRIERGYPRP